MEVWFIAVRKFGPQSGESWQGFVEWSGLTQLKEVITLDGSLCPCVIEELTADDWRANVDQDWVCFFFRDLEYLLKRVAGCAGINIIAAIRNPTVDSRDRFGDGRFEFSGYDLVEVRGDISALTNCGGFEKAFRNDELTELGLISSFERACEIRQNLRECYPDEHHARCDIWALWRMKQVARPS
jgi:hypothetical protein